MHKKLIYLTGAPATGKSTVGRELARIRDDIEFISYSTELVNYINNKNRKTDLDDNRIRELSALAVTLEDVAAVDAQLIGRCSVGHRQRHQIIDSHPVTKESYGFRVTGFRLDILQALSPDLIICFYASPDVIAQRIQADPGGRPLPESHELEMHTQMQASLATSYGVIVGCPVYLIDTDKELDKVIETMLERCKLDS